MAAEAACCHPLSKSRGASGSWTDAGGGVLSGGGGEADVVEEGLNMGNTLDCWQGSGWCLQVALHLLE